MNLDKTVHHKINVVMAYFWFGPGMVISVITSVGVYLFNAKIGTIVSFLWVGLMSAYANGMMHYNEHRQEKLAGEAELVGSSQREQREGAR